MATNSPNGLDLTSVTSLRMVGGNWVKTFKASPDIPGYVILYATFDGMIFDAKCASLKKNFNTVRRWFIHYDGPTLICSECGKRYPSAYGERQVIDSA